MDSQNHTSWYRYLDFHQQELVNVSFSLLEKKDALSDIKDFSFMVFPMSKAYEGFLKKVFYDLHLINKETYQGRRFRIGRALNPDIRNHQRDEDWLYDDVELQFGRKVARQLWETWLICRNHVFHYFSNEKQTLSFDEAKQKVNMIVESIQLVAHQLDINQNQQKKE